MSTRKSARRFHTWSDHERLTLCLLKQLDYVKTKARTALFNYIYQRRLAFEGFPCGLLATTLEAQYNEMKKGGKGHNILCEVEYTPRTDLRPKFADSFDELAQAAMDLDLETTSKLLYGHKGQVIPLSKRRRGASSIASIGELSLDDSNEAFTGWAPRKRSKMSQNEAVHLKDFGLGRLMSSTPHPPRLRSKVDERGNLTLQYPTILFRSAEPSHKFRSRKFQDETEIISCPPSFGSHEFRRLVWPHLKRNKAYQSPFISFAANSRTTLSRIETAKSEVDADERQFGIFSFCEMQADARSRYGADNGPYLVRSLFSDTEVSDLPNGYKGGGEWLCYGSVECTPIVVLEAEDAISLARCLLNMRTVDATAGVQLGKHLTLVPNKWKQVVAYCLLTAYKGKAVPKPGTLDYFEVMKGVYGLEDYRETSIAHSIPPSAYDEDLPDEDRNDAEHPIMIFDDQDSFREIDPEPMANDKHAEEQVLKNGHTADGEEWEMLSSDSDTDIPYKFNPNGKERTKSINKDKRWSDTNMLRGRMTRTMKKSYHSENKSHHLKATRCVYRISDLWSESESEDN